MDLEIEELEDSLDRDAVNQLRPNSILASLTDRVAGAFQLPENERVGPVMDKAAYVANYLFKAGVRDPAEVTERVIKLVDMAGVRTTEPQWILNGVYNFLESIREIQAQMNTSAHHGAQGLFSGV